MIKGTLNEFIIDRECTDKAILTTNFNIKRSRLTNALTKNVFSNELIKKYEKCIYYLTSDKYGELPLIYDENQKRKITYLESLRVPSWFTFYAMDWISQIGFYHKYINNRVLYVTGGTGVGKSTQVPKLLLYGLKMINHKMNGKVISTQPRTKPTIENAQRISLEMGVSIVETIKTLDEATNKYKNEKIKTFNGHVQYKTQKDSHISEITNYYFKEMTDGSFVHIRTIIFKGKRSAVFNTSTTLPSVASPSVKRTNSATCFDSTNAFSIPRILSITVRICLHNGVCPIGCVFKSSSTSTKEGDESIATSFPSLFEGAEPISTTCPLLSSRISVGNPVATDILASKITAFDTSSHLVQSMTFPSIICLPSPVSID